MHSTTKPQKNELTMRYYYCINSSHFGHMRCTVPSRPTQVSVIFALLLSMTVGQKLYCTASLGLLDKSSAIYCTATTDVFEVHSILRIRNFSNGVLPYRHYQHLFYRYSCWSTTATSKPKLQFTIHQLQLPSYDEFRRATDTLQHLANVCFVADC